MVFSPSAVVETDRQRGEEEGDVAPLYERPKMVVSQQRGRVVEKLELPLVSKPHLWLDPDGTDVFEEVCRFCDTRWQLLDACSAGLGVFGG